MSDTMNGRDLYLRHTDSKGNSHVARHRVWDAERFFDSQIQATKKANEKSDEKGSKATVSLATEADFLKGKK